MAPKDQPWWQIAKPCLVQKYFDDIYSEIETLRYVPVPKGTRGWYHQVLPCEDPKGQGSFVVLNGL